MKKRLCIDAGHGGNDNGAVYGFDEEDDINLSVANLLKLMSINAGFEVVMTRTKDIEVSLKKRCEIANEANADYFISLHCDAWHSQTTKGISTHVYRGAGPKTKHFGMMVHSSLMTYFRDHTNRGLKYSGFYVLHHTLMPAILIECEFISNPETRKFLHEPENQYTIAEAILKGIPNI